MGQRADGKRAPGRITRLPQRAGVYGTARSCWGRSGAGAGQPHRPFLVELGRRLATRCLTTTGITRVSLVDRGVQVQVRPNWTPPIRPVSPDGATAVCTAPPAIGLGAGRAAPASSCPSANGYLPISVGSRMRGHRLPGTMGRGRASPGPPISVHRRVQASVVGRVRMDVVARTKCRPGAGAVRATGPRRSRPGRDRLVALGER